MSYKTNSGKIKSVEFVPAGARVSRPSFVITTDNTYGQTTHWVSPAFINSFLSRNQMDGMSAMVAMRGATAEWQEKSVKAGEPVVGLDGNPVLDANKNPRMHTQNGYRTEQLRCTVGDTLYELKAKAEVKAATKARFSGSGLLAQLAAAGSAGGSSVGTAAPDDIQEEEGKSAEQLEAEALAAAQAMANETPNPKAK